MSLHSRAMLAVLVGAPLVWLVALGISLYLSSIRINDLFDTQQVRLARAVAAVLPMAGHDAGALSAVAEPVADGDDDPLDTTLDAGARTRSLVRHAPGQRGVELTHLALAVWGSDGSKRIDEQDGIALPFQAGAHGFREIDLGGQRWRAWYHTVPEADALIVVGQNLAERQQLQRELLWRQFLPWLLMLLVLLPALSVGLRRALQPVDRLADEIEMRRGGQFRPVRERRLPAELAPLAEAINRLFDRTAETAGEDRRFMADTARLLRTAFADIQMRWDTVTRTSDPAERRDSALALGRQLERTHALVTRFDELARLDAVDESLFRQRIDWAAVTRDALAGLAATADTSRVDIALDWRVPASQVLPIFGSDELMVIALRCLLENAVRHAPTGSRVQIVCEGDRVAVEDRGAGVPPHQMLHLGERYFRAGRGESPGLGLGLAIVSRIAVLHALQTAYANRDGGGFSAALVRR